MGRQNKTKCKTEELKSNINKTAFNIYFSSNFVFFVSSARTSCSIVLIFSLTWSHFILSPFPLDTNLKSHFFSASSMHCFYLFTITETTFWLVFSFCFKVLMSEVICLPFSLSFFSVLFSCSHHQDRLHNFDVHPKYSDRRISDLGSMRF